MLASLRRSMLTCRSGCHTCPSGDAAIDTVEVDMRAALSFSPGSRADVDTMQSVWEDKSVSASSGESALSSGGSPCSSGSGSQGGARQREAPRSGEHPRGRHPLEPAERVRRAVERAQAAMQRELEAEHAFAALQQKAEARKYLQAYQFEDEVASPECDRFTSPPALALEAVDRALSIADTPPESPHTSVKSADADLRVLQGKLNCLPRCQQAGVLGGM
mmetsp:Transcript_7710/g.23446  ORF Transcript_7710/g.23446 Transcript_7710/m.23446 type:complete len:219 (+) Transcript_7710:95-751(+)